MATPRLQLQRSASAERFASSPRPLLRGRAHLLAAVLGVPAAVAWVLLAPAGSARVAIAAFCGGVASMFVASALLHYRRWHEALLERLVRIDHTGIYLAMAGTGVGLGLLGLEGVPQRILLAAALVGAGLGIAVEWLPFAPPRGFSNAVYLTFGWLPIVLIPWLWSHAGAGTVGLLLAGGVLYTLGAVAVGLRRPDPWPRWFGYHEIFHVLVIAAVGAHAWMLARLVPGG